MKNQFVIKIVVVGEKNVGKTYLVNKFCGIKNKSQPTIIQDIFFQSINYNN